MSFLSVVLVSILACLWYLSVLGAFDPYSTWSILIIICTYLLLRCQLLNMYSSFSSMVIMPFPSIYRMLIYMFPLLSIIIGSYVLFCIMCLISGRFYLLALPQPLGILHLSPNLFCSFAITRVCILVSIWMTSWFLFTLNRLVRGHALFCVPCWSVLVSISIFPILTFASPRLLVSQGYVGILSYMSVSLPPDKLADIQQLALSLLQTAHVTVCKIMSFLGKANFCTNGHSQLHRLCSVIQSDMLCIYHSPTQLFSHFHFSISSLHQLKQLANLQQSPLPDVVIATDATPLIGPFIFRDLGYLYQLVVPGLVPCVGLILPCRNFMLLPLCYVKWPSTSVVRWLPCIWITVLCQSTVD